MVMAANRQRFSVTFSHGFSIWLRFWMDKALCSDAAAAQNEASVITANEGEGRGRLTGSGKARLRG